MRFIMCYLCSMKWDQIIGQETLKNKLRDSIIENRISHAQLLVGKSGYGALALALAYASEIICVNSETCYKRLNQFQHPDLHLSFPTINNSTEKREAVSADYVSQFRNFLQKSVYQELDQWYEFLNEEKKQGFISVKEIENIINNLSLKSFEGGYKVQIIWGVEVMRTEAANKLLKILEEPPAKTLFLLIADDEKKILPTILSRCQKILIPRIEETCIQQSLQNLYSLENNESNIIAKRSQGDWALALNLLNSSKVNEEFEKFFIQWNRAAVMAPKKVEFLKEIVEWSIIIAGWGREKQKRFLQFCSETFRQALLENYSANKLVNASLSYNNFNWKSFSFFVHGNNIQDILEEINSAYYHIERNGNARIIFLDMGVKLTRFLARKRE
ncbi:DNA polymerase III subunit delta' [Apibacter muscae]|nr:DNA polymerase III subunit delta' [Apibacter muscae]